LDISTAYLNANLKETIYMKVPPGYVPDVTLRKFRRPGVKLLKSLYGLRQSGREWYLRLTNHLIEKGFKRIPSQPCIFTFIKGEEICIIGVYVDDIVYAGTTARMEKVRSIISKEFKVPKHGPAKSILGLEIVQNKNGIFIHQSGYIKRTLQKFSHGCTSNVNTHTKTAILK
jgi:hypothetical protein